MFFVILLNNNKLINMKITTANLKKTDYNEDHDIFVGSNIGTFKSKYKTKVRLCFHLFLIIFFLL